MWFFLLIIRCSKFPNCLLRNQVKIVNDLYFLISCSFIFVNSTPLLSAPVSLVTLAPTKIMVTVGEQMTLTCTTSYCHPSAIITWHLSSTENSSTTIVTNKTLNGLGLVKTYSSLQKIVDKSDNEKLVHCTASNIPGRDVSSSVQTVRALCKLV